MVPWFAIYLLFSFSTIGLYFLCGTRRLRQIVQDNQLRDEIRYQSIIDSFSFREVLTNTQLKGRFQNESALVPSILATDLCLMPRTEVTFYEFIYNLRSLIVKNMTADGIRINLEVPLVRYKYMIDIESQAFMLQLLLCIMAIRSENDHLNINLISDDKRLMVKASHSSLSMEYLSELIDLTKHSSKRLAFFVENNQMTITYNSSY